MAWYDNAVFYHIYPLGLCGCAHENDGSGFYTEDIPVLREKAESLE